MKLSVEAKVAAAVAAGLMVMTSGAMAQGRHKGQTGGRNDLGPTNNSGVQMHMSQQESSKSSLFDSTNAEENRQKFSDKNVTSSVPQQVTSNVSQQGTSNVPQQGEDRQKARQKAEERRDDRQRREEHRDDRQQREVHNRQQREERRDDREQRQDRHQRNSTKDKSPFDGSILDVKPGQ